MSDDLLKFLLQRTSNLVLPFENINNTWCYLQEGIFYKCIAESEGAVKAVGSLPEAYHIAKKEGMCFFIISEAQLGGETIFNGAMIYNSDIENYYGDWWDFRIGIGEYPDDRALVAKYLKTLTFNRVEFPFMRMVTDELGIMMHIQPRYTKEQKEGYHLLNFLNRSLIFQLFTDNKWLWRIVYLNKEYFFDVKYVERIDCIFNTPAQYESFSKSNPSVSIIGLLVNDLHNWELRYYNEKRELVSVTKVKGEITPKKEFTFFSEVKKLSDNTVFLPTVRTKKKR